MRGYNDLGNPILFITESPHVAEFLSEALHCFGGRVVYSRPVNGSDNGTAGYLWWEYLPKVSEALDIVKDDKWHPIIIVNAVRFQCSEGLPTEDGPRDRNFMKLFFSQDNQLSASYLIQAIKLLKPYKVAVACTRGNKSYIKEWLKKNRKEVYASIHETSLRGCVEHVLLQNDIKFVSVGHPCSWYKSSCRKPRKLKMLKKLRSVK